MFSGQSRRVRPRKANVAESDFHTLVERKGPGSTSSAKKLKIFRQVTHRSATPSDVRSKIVAVNLL